MSFDVEFYGLEEISAMDIAGPSGTLPGHGSSFFGRCGVRADRIVAQRRLGRADRTSPWVADRFPGAGILRKPLGLLVLAAVRERVRGLLQNVTPPPMLAMVFARSGLCGNTIIEDQVRAIGYRDRRVDAAVREVPLE
jgi:hypothetical protein